MWILGGSIAALVVAVVASMALSANARTWVEEDSYLVEVLSGIDFIPEREDLDVLDVGPEELIHLARDYGRQGIDPGVRVRAYSALAAYETATEAELQEAIAEHSEGPVSALDFVYLRAAMEALAKVGGPDAAMTLVALLDHQTRDIRATTARAIGIYGLRIEDLILVDELRQRLEERLRVEEVAQVRRAIGAALQDIDAALGIR